MDAAFLALAGAATALATGVGAVPVFLLGERADRLRPFLWGTAVGLMGVASVVGLLLPALSTKTGARPSQQASSSGRSSSWPPARGGRYAAVAGTVAGGGVMLTLAAFLGVD